MKKGLHVLSMAALALMLSANVAMAGDGNGNGKKTIIQIESIGSETFDVVVKCTPENDFDLSKITLSNTQNFEIVDVTVNPGELTIRIHPKNVGTAALLGNLEVVGIDNITGVMVDDGGAPNTSTTKSGTRANIKITDDSTPSGNSSNNGNSSGSSSIKNPTGNTGNSSNDVKNNTPTNDHIEVYPNPVQTETNVVTVGEILMRSIQVFDLSGKLQRDIQVGDATQQYRLDLSDLRPGIYMIMVHTNGKTHVQKISKVN